MGKTSIEWATHTWNPITGCTPVSEGCKNCYAARMAKRLAGRFGYPEAPNQFDVTFHPDKLEEPLHWRKPRVVFVCSMGDLFHEDVEYEQLDKIFAAMSIATKHTFLVLTKRPDRAREYLLADRGCLRDTADRVDEAIADEFDYWDAEPFMFTDPWPPSHIYLGVSVENQDYIQERVGTLMRIPAAKRFISFEPLLGAISDETLRGIFTGWPEQVGPDEWVQTYPIPDGVIVGGESGPGARPMHPDWVYPIRDWCVEAGVAFTFKQWGAWAPHEHFDIADFKTEPMNKLIDGNGEDVRWGLGSKDPIKLMVRVGKKGAGRELDGQVWDQFPWDLLTDDMEGLE